jgi:hypothetical protein
MNMKLKKTTLGFTTFCAALVALGFWIADPLNLRAPSDQELITIFQHHRVAFEQLRQLLTEDLRNAPVNKSGVRRLRAIQSPQYYKLVADIYPGVKVLIDWDSSVRFIFQGGGLGSEWLKGIEYVPGELQLKNYLAKGNLLQNLDNARNLPEGVYLREIEPNWYIVYQRDN